MFENVRRHFLMLQILAGRRRASKARIIERLESEGLRTSDRTFHRDIEYIEKNYQIIIRYNRLDDQYYIDNVNIEGVDQTLHAFDFFEAMIMSANRRSHIIFEGNSEMGASHINGLLEAIEKKLIIRMTYQDYKTGKEKDLQIRPYAIKEFKRRFYLLGREKSGGKIESYGLDTIVSVTLTNENFEYIPNFDPEKRLKNCIGLDIPEDTEPVDVILAFTPEQARNFKANPIFSYHIVTDNPEETGTDSGDVIIRLFIRINKDLVTELLSFGNTVRVLGPEALVQTMRNTIQEMSRQYGLLPNYTPRRLNRE